MKKNNIFQLEFKEKYSNLTGNKYGSDIYKEQVGNNINYNEKITIIFPNYISSIGTSFIQGFFEVLVSKIGLSGINENVEVIAKGIPNVKEIILKRLTFWGTF